MRTTDIVTHKPLDVSLFMSSVFLSYKKVRNTQLLSEKIFGLSGFPFSGLEKAARDAPWKHAPLLHNVWPLSEDLRDDRNH